MTRDLLPEFQRAPTLVESLELRRDLSSTAAAKSVAQRLRYVKVSFRQVGENLPPPASCLVPPLVYVDELYSQVGAFFPGSSFKLFLPNSVCQVSNQFELDCAYLDLPVEAISLELEITLLTVGRVVPNAQMLDSMNAAEQPSTLPAHLEGPWLDAEKVLFDHALGLYGWGNWEKIASAMMTRSARDVEEFARGEKAPCGWNAN